MTIQLIKQTNKGVTGEFWKLKSIFKNNRFIEVEFDCFYDLDNLEKGIVLDSIKVLNESNPNPFKDKLNNAIFLELITNNPNIELINIEIYFLEKYIIQNIPGWEEGIQI